MKKHLLLAFFMLVTFGVVAQTGVTSGSLNKNLQKECTRQAKRLAKEGWMPLNATQTMYDALSSHYVTIQEKGGEVMTLESRGVANNRNLALRKSLNNASFQYASMKSSRVEGEIKSKIAATGTADVEVDNGIEMRSHTQTNESVKNMVPTVSLYRQLENGKFEVLSFFVVSHEQ
jgi:hypothetical protein